MQNDLVKRLAWMGFVAGVESLASIAALRLSAMAWRRMFGEDPPGFETMSTPAPETTDGAARSRSCPRSARRRWPSR